MLMMMVVMVMVMIIIKIIMIPILELNVGRTSILGLLVADIDDGGSGNNNK